MRLRYTTPAFADLDAILDDITASSPRGARRVLARIQHMVSLIPLNPGIGLQTEDPAIRRLATPPYPYLVFYEPTDTEIIVHAIRHTARDPSGMPGTA